MYWVVTCSNYKDFSPSLSLSFLDSRRRKKITIETKENLEKIPIISLKRQCSTLLPHYRGPRGLFIAFRRRGHPTTSVGSNAWSTAKGLPRIAARATFPRQNLGPCANEFSVILLCLVCLTGSSRKWRICFESVQIWASLLWASKFLFNSFKNHKNWAFFSI